ncbi:MAG TPA: hypothetical protein VKZ18_18755 [Polyangia bacterium]|nr:hypothetical protein [Polyangia bacterium]
MARGTVRWIALVATLVAAGTVRAAETADGLPKLEYRTAYTVGAGNLYVGILAFEYGINSRLDIGVDPPEWAVRAAIPVLIPNLHIKQTILDQGPLTVSVRVAGYWALLQTTDNNDSASLIVAPISLFASYRLLDRLWLHGEGAYTYAHAFGSGDFNQLHFGGAVGTQAVQIGAMLEWRLTRIFSLTATGRYQVYTADLAFSANGNIDPYTSATVDGRAVSSVPHPWQAIGGVAFLWHYVHLIAGVGYGYFYLPGVNLAYPQRTIVPDGEIALVFHL